jgi:hypothetical protein
MVQTKKAPCGCCGRLAEVRFTTHLGDPAARISCDV